jgi:hypothetical protein
MKNTSPILDSASPVTELSLLQLRSMPEEKAATFLDLRLRALEDAWKRSYVERGVILIEVQDRQLWRWMVDFAGEQYESFEGWVCRAAPQSRSDCFAAMRAVRELHEIPMKELSEIPRCNVEVLRSLSSGVRIQPEVVAAAQALPEREFREKIKQDHPDQHVSARRKLILTFDSGDYDLICQVLDDVGQKLGISDREGEVLALVIDFQQEHDEENSPKAHTTP